MEEVSKLQNNYSIVESTNTKIATDPVQDESHIQKPGNRRTPLPPVGNPKWKILGIGEHWRTSINSFTDWFWYRPHSRGLANKNNLRLCYYQCCCVDNNKTSCKPWVRTCCTNIWCGSEKCGLVMSFPLFCSCICISVFLCGGDDDNPAFSATLFASSQHGVCECCCEICPLYWVRATCHTPCLYCSRILYTVCCCPSSTINADN